MAESIFRVKKTENFTIISNHILRNPNLSFKGKGLLSLLLSLPTNWELSIEGLIRNKMVCEKRDAINSTLKELEKLGYVVRKQEKDERGRFTRYVYEVHENPVAVEVEKPLTDNPVTDNPVTDGPLPESPKQLNTNIQNTNKTKILNKEKTEEVEENIVSTNSKENNTSSEDLNLVLEEILGHKLDGMEKFFVKKWISKGYSSDLVYLAAADNMYRKSLNASHIDATLDMWNEAGVKTTSDATNFIDEAHKKNLRKLKQKGKDNNPLKTGAEMGIVVSDDEVLPIPSKYNSDEDDEIMKLFGGENDDCD